MGPATEWLPCSGAFSPEPSPHSAVIAAPLVRAVGLQRSQCGNSFLRRAHTRAGTSVLFQKAAKPTFHARVVQHDPHALINATLGSRSSQSRGESSSSMICCTTVRLFHSICLIPPHSTASSFLSSNRGEGSREQWWRVCPSSSALPSNLALVFDWVAWCAFDHRRYHRRVFAPCRL